MNFHLFPTSSLFLAIIITFSALIHIPACLCQDNEQYVTCGGSVQCANIPNIRYPFWGGGRPAYCGHPSFGLTNCQGDVPMITIQTIRYRVLEIGDNALTVAREDLWNTTCPASLHNTTLDFNIFSYAPGDQNITLAYDCTATGTGIPSPPGPAPPNQFNCSDMVNYFSPSESPTTNLPGVVTCNQNIIVPVNQSTGATLQGTSASVPALREGLASGFGLQWSVNNENCTLCSNSGGECGQNTNSTLFACYCRDQSYPLICGSNSQEPPRGGGGGSKTQLNIILPIVGAIIAGVGIGWLIFFCRQRRKRLAAQAQPEPAQTESKGLTTPPSSKGLTTTHSSHFTRSIPSYPSSKSDFGKASTYFGVQVFSYEELEEATENFDPSKELGDGGFGTVYYGKLRDGRVVAVKRLYENNFKRVEQFLNEVEILTRLNHQYLVKLYGCTSKRSRELLLVYEYIPNGTVADHLHGKKANSGLLTWAVRLNIAIETADALAYLHESDIIHRDVKTNNILLDNSFCVKVADFGLSRLFPLDATHVSTAPQGTPGYVDPEYYQCYQLTDKSDVYSFGVVLIELISSLEAVDTNRHRHDINLANMAISKIQNHTLNELVDSSLGFETDTSVRRMTTLVAELAFRCLQQEKDMRPSMKEVLDTLRGIQNEELDVQKAEVLDIIVDDGVLEKANTSPSSPESGLTEKLVSSSAPNSSG